MVDNPFGNDYTSPPPEPEVVPEGGGESESPANEDKAEAPAIEAEAIVEPQATRPKAPITQVCEILREYNYRETDIPLTHEYWRLRDLARS